MIYLALGSNVGEGAEQLKAARRALRERGLEIVCASALYQSAALLPEDAPEVWDQPYTNQVLEVHGEFAPEELLELAKEIEGELGREALGHWGPREIDIDIIAMEDTILETEHLTIPHAEMAKRDFVLRPLKEIAPHWVHPVTKQTVSELIEALPESEQLVAC